MYVRMANGPATDFRIASSVYETAALEIEFLFGPPKQPIDVTLIP